MTFRALNSIVPAVHHVLTRVRRTWGFALVLLSGVMVASAQTNDPAITTQPAGGNAMVGEDWGFSVVASGTTPFSYQWLFNGAPLPGRTNSTLEFADVQNGLAGSYSVIVTNVAGRVTSDTARLTIVDTPPRTLRNGSLTTGGTTRVPFYFAGNGREQRITFSLNFDTNVVTNPRWANALTNASSFSDLSQTANGNIGISIEITNQAPAAEILLGEVEFDAGISNTPFLARLQFTNAPLALEAFNTNGTALAYQYGIIPQVDLVDTTPVLDLQSGLMEQRIRISYAGAQTLTNVDLAVRNLTVDSLTNAVTLYNGVGTKSIDVTGYGTTENLPFVGAGRYDPGTRRVLTLEYYVSDRITPPSPEYFLDLGEEKVFNVPTAATPLNINIARFVDGTYVIQFDSVGGFVYYVQYAQSIEDLENNGPTVRVVDPPITGTGFSVQWIDNGPPKTESPPIDGMRFYRVVELPVN